MRALLAVPEPVVARMFDPERRRRLRDLVDLVPDHAVADLAAVSDGILADVEVVITGWGSPLVDGEALRRMPHLRAIVHTAGTVRSVTGPELWRRPGLVVTTAAQANAVPVAEFTLAHVLLAGKRSLRQEADHRARRQAGGTGPLSSVAAGSAIGNHGAVVGLIGASRIGRLVAELLLPFDHEVLIADPYLDAEGVRQLGARHVELPELFATSDVVSLHAPDVPSTRHMVGAPQLALMRDGTTFINTARPALVDEQALRAELVTGRLSAVLDVHDHLDPDDPLWSLSTVSITPHIAGSQGNELLRMADHALEELRRLSAGEPAWHPVDGSRLAITA